MEQEPLYRQIFLNGEDPPYGTFNQWGQSYSPAPFTIGNFGPVGAFGKACDTRRGVLIERRGRGGDRRRMVVEEGFDLVEIGRVITVLLKENTGDT